MLKNIPTSFSPELLKILMEMGHFDEIVIADGNFPAASNARNLIRADGIGSAGLVDDLLRFFPLDDIGDKSAAVMEVSRPGIGIPPIWTKYEESIARWDGRTDCIEQMPRWDFYERASRAYAIVATSESALFANIILKKGVVRQD